MCQTEETSFESRGHSNQALQQHLFDFVSTDFLHLDQSSEGCE